MIKIYFHTPLIHLNTTNIQSAHRGENVLKLLQDVATRWNSEFFMIYRLLELKQPMCIALSQIEEVEEISKGEWKI